MLYHRRVAKRLQADSFCRLRIKIARDFDKPHVLRLDQLLENSRLDAVLVHVRSEFTRKASLITIHCDAGRIHYYWHPFLFRRRQFGWAEIEAHQFSTCREIYCRVRANPHPLAGEQGGSSGTISSRISPDQSPELPSETRIFGLSIRNLFYAMGSASGLDVWAIRDEINMLDAVRTRCQQLGLPLIVMGPSRRPGSRWLDRLCIKLDQQLRSTLNEWHLDYCSLPHAGTAGESYYGADGFHFTADGHGYVAQKLLPVLSKWIRA
jgi:hypothetical protein